MTDDEDYDIKNTCIGTGAASTTDRRRPTAAERKEIAIKRPIGFVHFKEKPKRKDDRKRPRS